MELGNHVILLNDAIVDPLLEPFSKIVGQGMPNKNVHSDWLENWAY